MTAAHNQFQQRLDTLRQPFAWAITWPDDEVSFTRREPDQSIKDMDLLITPLYAASGDVRDAVIEPTDGHGHTGKFTATEFNERAWDHEKAAKNGLSAGPNVSYVRTFQACAVALRYAAKHMFSQSPATDATADDLKHHARFLLDRLQEFDPGDFEAEREFHGHVAPAIARLRNALGVA